MTDDKENEMLYQKILLRKNGLSISELSTIVNLSKESILKDITKLERRGLVEFNGRIVKPILWWDDNHIEVFLNIPQVSNSTFKKYCNDIDNFFDDLKDSEFKAIRPHLHETSIEIMIGAAAAFTILEFLKGFLSELGKKLATFIEKSTTKYKDDGLNHVEIKVIRKLDGCTDIVFSIKGKDTKSVLMGFTNLIETFEQKESELKSQNDLIMKGENWKFIYKKTK